MEDARLRQLKCRNWNGSLAEMKVVMVIVVVLVVVERCYVVMWSAIGTEDGKRKLAK